MEERADKLLACPKESRTSARRPRSQSRPRASARPWSHRRRGTAVYQAASFKSISEQDTRYRTTRTDCERRSPSSRIPPLAVARSHATAANGIFRSSKRVTEVLFDKCPQARSTAARGGVGKTGDTEQLIFRPISISLPPQARRDRHATKPGRNAETRSPDSCRPTFSTQMSKPACPSSRSACRLFLFHKRMELSGMPQLKRQIQLSLITFRKLRCSLLTVDFTPSL